MENILKEFLNHLLSERGFSAHTISAYRNDLLEFAVDLSKSKTVTPRDIEHFVDRLTSTNYTPATCARKIASLKSFMGFLVAEGHITSNPAVNIKYPRAGRLLPKSLTIEDINSLLDYLSLQKTSQGVRDWAMVEILYGCGLRISELVALNIQDINMTEKTIRCLGKNRKYRIVPMHNTIIIALQEYLNSHRAELIYEKEITSSKPLFISTRGKRISRQGFWLRLKKYAGTVINSQLNPHKLRHTFATHMLQGGASIRHVQDLLGHASISTTQIYTQLPSEYLKLNYDKAHPRS